MSPPLGCTAGRIRVSISSFNSDAIGPGSPIISGVLPASGAASMTGVSSTTGRPATKCSMTIPRTGAFNRRQSASSALCRVMASWSKATERTPSTANNRLASGEAAACAASR
jgi:hypothetical protein